MSASVTPVNASASTILGDAQYRASATALLDAIERQMDVWLQEDLVDVDAHRSGGVLELTLPNGSKVIVNLQAPLQEVWLAARAGGFHFRHTVAGWRDTKTDDEFFDTLERCLSQQTGLELRFER